MIQTTTKKKTPAIFGKKGAKVAAAYASYQSASRSARIFADRHAHTMLIDSDLSYDRYFAASRFCLANRFNMPFAKKAVVVREETEENFVEMTWTYVRVPGQARPVQARVNGYRRIEFRAAFTSDLDRVLDLINEEVTEEEEVEIAFDPFDYEPETTIIAWGKDGWEGRKTRRARSFKSVFVPADLQAAIEADLKSYTESRKRLQRLELPWRRGYLLDGPPGTGKTSMSLAIAGSLGFNLATLSLTEIKSDADLRKAVSQLRPRTVLVIEDIDAYSVSNDREHNTAKDGALSLSGLLNALDGFETPDGLVTICTTNHPEKLDAALTRSGRLDRTFHLGYIEAPELERLYEWFYETKVPSPAPASVSQAKVAPAEAMELFKQHLNEPEAGWAAVLDRCEPRIPVVNVLGEDMGEMKVSELRARREVA